MYQLRWQKKWRRGGCKTQEDEEEEKNAKMVRRKHGWRGLYPELAVCCSQQVESKDFPRQLEAT